MKKIRTRDRWRRQFCSSMASVARFFDGLMLREVHIECLRRTTFYHFLKPFVKGKITVGLLHGMQGTLQFLMAYNKDEKCFKVGDKKLTIGPREFDLIFGIRFGHQEIDMTKSNAASSALVQRKFCHAKCETT